MYRKLLIITTIVMLSDDFMQTKVTQYILFLGLITSSLLHEGAPDFVHPLHLHAPHSSFQAIRTGRSQSSRADFYQRFIGHLLLWIVLCLCLSG